MHFLTPSFMQPLTRQQTHPSVHSWWSDSNPGLRGPTINLHAVAKPLLRMMHHRQALEFIRKNRDSPLSRTTLEIYSSYFPWDYVSGSTKIAILSELTTRTASEVDARAVVDSPVFNYIAEMLGSSDTGARSSSCRLLGSLASHECTSPAILKLMPCERLVSLLCDKDPNVILGATYALSQIARWLDGAQAIVFAKTPDHILELLESPTTRVRKWTCKLVRRLVVHKSTAPAILALNLSVRLVSLQLRESDIAARASARFALDAINQQLDDGAVPKTLEVELTSFDVYLWDVETQSASPIQIGRKALEAVKLPTEALGSVFHPNDLPNSLICLRFNDPEIGLKFMERVGTNPPQDMGPLHTATPLSYGQLRDGASGNTNEKSKVDVLWLL